MNNPLQAFFINTVGPMSENGLVCDRGALQLGRPPLHLVPTLTVKGDGDDLKNLILGREELGSIRPFPAFPGRVQGPMLKGLCVFLLCRFSPFTLMPHSSQCCSVTILALPVYISVSI